MTGNSGSTDFINDVYGDIYLLGDGCKRAAIAVFKAVGFFFKKIFGIFVLVFSFFKKSVSGILKKITNEAVKIITEVKAAVPKISESGKESKSKGIASFFKYVRRYFSVHKRFNRAVLSTAVPAVMLAVLLVFVSTFQGITFGVSVYVNGRKVGTVKNESIYKEASKEALARIKSADGVSSVITPDYKIDIAAANSLSDSGTLCDNIIAAVSEKTVSACGVYINGKFLCAVDSEDTFNRVKDSVLDEYIATYGYSRADNKVDFVDDITTSTGLYPDNDNIWSAKQLSDYMNGYKVKPIEHTVKDGEKAEDILEQYNITIEELKSLNKELDERYIPAGSTLLIKNGKRNLDLKATVTYEQIKTTNYGTVSQYDNNLFIGTSMVVVEGVHGHDAVSYADTYIDGKKTGNSYEISRYNINSPVNELIKIGTKGIPVDPSNNNIPVSPRLLRDQGGTFIWPAPDNCFWLSQGYNPGNSHYGIDIVSSDNGSCRGRRIVAVADGIVVMATYHYSWGYYIRVDHGDGVVTGYAHALKDSFRVNVGDYVKAGQELSSIGTTGNSSGYHLHFEVWLDGTRVNPLPYVYSQYTGVAVK